MLFAVLLATSLLWHGDIIIAQQHANVPPAAIVKKKSSEKPEAVVLGFVRLVNGRIRTWGPPWMPTDLPVPPVSELKELETVGVFRVTENAWLQGLYRRENSGFYFSRTWRAATDPAVVFATIEVPSDRYTGTVETSAMVVTGREQTFELTADDVGKRKYIGKLELDSFFDLKSQNDSSIRLSVIRNYKVQMPLFATTTDGKFVPGEIIDDVSTSYRELRVTQLRFYVPIEKLSGIVIAPAGMGTERFEHANLGLQPDIVPQLPGNAEAGKAQVTIPEISDSHTLRLTLPNGAIAEVMGVGRLHNDQPEWWSVDGRDQIKIADVTAADLHGLGTVIAMKLDKYSSATPYLEHDRRREYIGERSVSLGSGVILVGLDPTHERASEDLTISVAAAEPEILQRVEVTQKSVSIPKTDDRVISRLLKAESVGPDQCSVLFNFQPNGLLTFVGIDRSGAVVMPSDGLIAAKYAKLTFPVPLEQLQEILVRHYPRANAKIEGISLRPGNITTLTTSIAVVARKDEQIQQDRDRDDGSSNWDSTSPGALGKLVFGITLKGMVVDADGKPVPEVPIISDAISELRKNPHPKEICRSDANGEFEFHVTASSRFRDLAAMNDKGFGSGHFEHPDVPVRIVFRPWGSVSGTLRLGDKSAVNDEIHLLWFKTQTDADGTFEFPKVPFGRAQLVSRRDVSRPGRSDPGHLSLRTEVFVDAGKTTIVNLGGSGRTVVGRITLPEDYSNKISLDGIRGEIKRIPEDPPYPPGIGWEDQKQAWYHEWAGEPAGREYLKRSLTQSFRIEAEGVFVIHDIPPGDYELTATSTGGQKNAMFAHLKFTVDDDPSNTPVAIGEINAIIIGP